MTIDSPVDPADEHKYDEIEINNMVYAAYEEVSLAGMKAARAGQSKGRKLLLYDSGSTCVVVENEDYCINIQAAKIPIKVGGGVLMCIKIGDFKFKHKLPDGTYAHYTAVGARIVPNFGCNIFMLIMECVLVCRALRVVCEVDE